MVDQSREEPDEKAAKDLISLAQAAHLTGLSQGHLRWLANRGQIWAKKIGRNWVTSEAAVRDYLQQERRPGPRKSET